MNTSPYVTLRVVNETGLPILAEGVGSTGGVYILTLRLDKPPETPMISELCAELRSLLTWVEAETDGRDWPHKRLNAVRAMLGRALIVQEPPRCP